MQLQEESKARSRRHAATAPLLRDCGSLFPVSVTAPATARPRPVCSPGGTANVGLPELLLPLLPPPRPAKVAVMTMRNTSTAAAGRGEEGPAAGGGDTVSVFW